MWSPTSRASYLLILVIAACGGSAPAPAPARPSSPAATPSSSADRLVPLCEKLFARKATCADDYLPVLLDLRVELNLPPGIGEQVETEGRDAVLATAHAELARDTEPAKVEALCKSVAAKLPPEQADPLLAQGGRCDAAEDCKAFAACVVELDRGFLASGAGPAH